LTSNHWIRISEIAYFVFVVVVAVVLVSRYVNDLGTAALLGAGSFVGLSLLGWFIFEKILPEH
jgi:Na+/citrate or Na+/malate symporter